MLLPYVLEYNLPARSQRIGELLLPLGGAELFGAIPAEFPVTVAVVDNYGQSK